MKLKEILKALQDGTKLEFQRGGNWYPVRDTGQLPCIALDNSHDIDSVRIAKTYVTISGVEYEVPTACKRLDNGQDYYSIGTFRSVEPVTFNDYYDWHNKRLKEGLAFRTREDAEKAAAILSATIELFKK